MSFNVWTPQNQVIAGGGFSNPNVIFDTNPQVLVGPTQVFKMWCCQLGSPAIYYFESTDGVTWTASGSNPILNATTLPRVFKVGSTYYLYSSDGFPATTIHCYTSPDGINWTLANSNAIVAGTGWEAQVYQLCLVDVIAGTWYAYYNGEDGLGGSAMGLATSTDGIHWTKGPSNPVITAKDVSNIAFFKVGSTYYGLYDGTPSNDKAPNVRALYTLISSSVTGPWTPITFNGTGVPAYYAATASDLSGANTNSSLGDPTIVEVNGNVYLYYTVDPGGVTQGINGAIAFGQTFDTLIQTLQGVVNVPFSDIPGSNLTTTASDNFQRADTNPIGGNWTPTNTAGAFGPAQLASHNFEVASANTATAAFWNAFGWGADQWSQVTISASNSGSDVGVVLRQDLGGAITFYNLLWTGALGSTGQWFIQKRIANATSTLATGNTPVTNVGDTILGVVIGTSLYLYWNGILIATATDSSISSGAPGIFLFANGNSNVAAVSAWSGGTFQAPAVAATPTFSPVAGTYGSTQNVTISTTTPAATIYYTTDGSTPTTSSTQYTGPVAVASSLTLSAIATATGFSQSLVGTAAYVIFGNGLLLSGNISVNGVPLAGATVTWSGQASGFAVTDSFGNWTSGSILSAGNYFLVPSATGYTFQPTSVTKTISTQSIVGINFLAIPSQTEGTVSKEIHIEYTGAPTLVQSDINSPDNKNGSSTVQIVNENLPLVVTPPVGLPQPGSFGTVHGRFDTFSVINNPDKLLKPFNN